jgi:integrase/recombinase XerD
MKPVRLYLPYADWPKEDRTLWEAAFKMGSDLFEDRGPATHRAERTRLQLQYTYGKFLWFLSAHHPGLLARPPAERVNRTTIEGFVKWQPKSCGGITIGIYLYHLWLALRYISPDENWSWLLSISKRIAEQTKKKPEKNHLVTSETLYALGAKLMDRAITDDATKNVSITKAMEYRDGLIIALAALIPLRRRTLAALRIGKHFVQSGDLWALDIPAEDTKTKRPLEYPISADLSGRIDFYLNKIRLRLLGTSRHDHVWVSSKRRPMHNASIYNAVRRRTHKALGFPVNLHRFRQAAATLWSIRDPSNVRGAKDLLGHASFDTTEKYYIMARSRLAGRALARAIESKQKGAALRP